MAPDLDAWHVIMDIRWPRNYNREMPGSTIERLLETANSSTDGDTSVNVAKRQFLDENECIAFFDATRANLSLIDEWKKNSSVTDYAVFSEAGEKADDGRLDTGKRRGNASRRSV